MIMYTLCILCGKNLFNENAYWRFSEFVHYITVIHDMYMYVMSKSINDFTLQSVIFMYDCMKPSLKIL